MKLTSLEGKKKPTNIVNNDFFDDWFGTLSSKEAFDIWQENMDEISDDMLEAIDRWWERLDMIEKKRIAKKNSDKGDFDPSGNLTRIRL